MGLRDLALDVEETIGCAAAVLVACLAAFGLPYCARMGLDLPVQQTEEAEDLGDE